MSLPADTTFAARLKKARTAADLTQEEARLVLEVSRSVIEKWERGDRTPLAITQEGALARLRKKVKKA